MMRHQSNLQHILELNVCIWSNKFPDMFQSIQIKQGGGRHRAHYPATVYPWERNTNIYSIHATSVKLVISFYLKSKRCSQIY